MTQVLTMIEAYGACMAEGNSGRAREQLEAIQRTLASSGDEQFAEFWEDVPARLLKAGPLPAEASKMVCELAWWNGRQSLVKGADYRKQETPKFLGRNNAIQTRP